MAADRMYRVVDCLQLVVVAWVYLALDWIHLVNVVDIFEIWRPVGHS